MLTACWFTFDGKEAMYKAHRIAVVMPVHNEQGHVCRAIARVPDFVDVIIVVDDGSYDRTWAEISQCPDTRLRKIRHPLNRGVGAAIKTGYQYALELEVDLIAVMDGDGQMAGEDLFLLLDEAISGTDYVKGNRFLLREGIGLMPPSRYIGNRVLSWLTRRAVGYADDLDAQCGYTVIAARALRRLKLERLYDRYGFPNEMFFAAYGAGLRIRSVPVRTIYGDEVSDINPLTAIPKILWLIVRAFARPRLALAERNAELRVQESRGGATE